MMRNLMMLLLLAGCGGEGRIEIGLAWPDGASTDGAWVFARVESRQVSAEPGPVLAEASPIEYRGSGTRIELPGVPNGDRRVLVVEIRRSPTREGTVEYFGLSEPFSLIAGEERTTRLEVPLTRPPQILGGLGIDGFAADEEAIVPSSMVSLHVSSDSGQRVRISNDPDLLGPGTEDFELSEQSGAEAGLCPPPAGAKRACTYRIEWDLLAGASGCEDGCLRRVFVRFADAFGYTSATLARFVAIDPKGPTVLPESVGVQLVPAQDNLRLRPRAVRPGTRVIVTFGFDEIATPLRVRTTTPEPIELLPADEGAGSKTTYVFTHTFLAGSFPSEGPYFLEVTARDQAGHVATSPVAAPGLDCGGCAFIVDVTPPDPPQVDTEGAIVLHRIPWTRDPSFGFARTTVVVDPAAVEAGAAVVVEDPVLGELGRSLPVDEPGFGPIVLSAADAEEVLVRAVDLAGNTSTAARIRDVRWTATLAGKVANSGSPNPHRVSRGFEERDAIWQRLDRIGDEPATEEIAKASTSDGDSLEASSTMRWMRVSSSPPASNTSFFGAAFDSMRGRTVLPGAATWAFDGTRWQVLDTLGTAPAGSIRSATIYDPVRDRVFVFGGGSSNTVGFTPGDLWAFDGQRWSEVIPADSEVPADLSQASLAIDTRRRELLLFGGSRLTYHDDLWAFDGSRWRRADASPRPPPRAAAGFAHDPVRDRAVLFGGVFLDEDAQQVVQRSDTWEWDGAQWLEATSGPSPPTGIAGRMVFDPERERIIWLNDAGDLWSWDGTAWSEHDPIADPISISAVLRAGQETLSWNGSAWITVPTAHGAPPGGGLTVYDRARSRMIAMRTNAGTVHERVAGAWILTSTSVPAGGFRRYLEDAPGDEVMLHTDDGTTWLWDGVRFRQHQGASPLEHVVPQLAYDPIQDRTLLFGGLLSNDTALWQFDGQDWTASTPAGTAPPTRGFAGSTFDPLHGRFLIFGGALWNESNTTISGKLNDTWIWEGVRWVQVGLLPPQPERRDSMSLRFDEYQGRAVLYGGTEVDTWIFDGDAWREIALDRARPPPASSSIFYDPELEQISVWTGTERWALSRSDRPALSFQLDWSQAAAPVEAIRSVQVKAVAGGRGCASREAGCAIAEGARLFVRRTDAERWVKPAEITASFEEPALVELASISAAEAQSMVVADAIDVLLRPTGVDFAEVNAGVAVDYVEVTVEYRLP